MAPRLAAFCILLGLILMGLVFADMVGNLARIRREKPAPVAHPTPSPSGSPAGYALLGADATCEVTYEATWRNTSRHPRPVDLQVPVIRSYAPRQIVTNVTMSSPPARQYRDRWDNPVADFHFDGVKPGAVARAEIRARVTCRLAAVDVDARAAAAPPLNDPALRRYLGATPGFPADAPWLLARSRRIVGGETAAWFKLIRLYDFVRSLDFRMDKKPQDVRAALASGRVQCSDAAQIMVTLARSIGLPTRYVAGFYHRDNDPDRFSSDTHAWAEAYLRPYGWLPLDPTMGRFDDSLRLSRLAQEMPGYVALWRGSPQAASASVRTAAGATAAYGAAIRFKVRPLASHPASPEVAARLGVDLSGLKVRPRPDGPADAAARQALALLAKGDPEGARALLRRTVMRAPTAWAPQAAMVDVAARDGTLDKLRAGYLSARAATFHIPRWIQLDVAGLVDLRQGRYGAARDELEGAVKLPCGPPAWRNLGAFYVRTRQASRAVDAYQEALRADPASDGTWQALIGMYAALEVWECVARTADSAAAALPRDAAFPTESGQAWFRLNRYGRAARAFRRALTRQPKNGWLHAMLGWTLQQEGRRPAARRELRRGLALGIPGPDHAFFERLAKNRGQSTE